MTGRLCPGEDSLTPPILIGTSGWSYAHWHGPFYPADLPQDSRLEYYAWHFQSVEINNTFYHLPEKQTLQRWRDAVSSDFVFAVKASRYITHTKKLREPSKSLAAFFERISVLEDQLGPVLFQLPPRWHFNRQRLAAFLNALSREFRYAFEFRDPSWLNAHALALLSEHNAAFCIYELNGFLSPKEITTDFVYVRLHGPDGPYQGSYDTRTLSGWAKTFATWAAQGYRIYCYFDNDQAGYAVHNALYLKSMLQG